MEWKYKMRKWFVGQTNKILLKINLMFHPNRRRYWSLDLKKKKKKRKTKNRIYAYNDWIYNEDDGADDNDDHNNVNDD